MKRSRTVKKQTISAILMALAGTAIHAGSQSYLSSYDITEVKTVRPAADSLPGVPEETNPVERETEEALLTETLPETEAETKAVFSPSLSALNLAYIYPEDAKSPDAENSEAGKVIRELSLKDSQWLASIYDLASGTPEEAAAKLGQPPESVRGLYNPVDENQKADDPGSWTIPEWSHIDMAFTDENGNRSMADSNIKEIMALANTYFYYLNPEDGSVFRDYARKLWDESHSVVYSIGEVYYCEGCLEEAAGAPGTEETPGSDSASDSAPGIENEERVAVASGGQESAEIGPGIPTAPETTVYAEGGGEGTAETESLAAANSAAEESMTAAASGAVTESMTAAANGAVTESVTAEESGAAIETVMAAESSAAADASSAVSETAFTAAGQTDGGQETAPVEIGPGIALMEASKAAETVEAEEETEIKCPGHVDLHITATVTGLSASENSLFSLAEGLAQENGSPRFAGWNEENRNAAITLANQDWKSVYGLTVSSAYIMNPLTSSEIDHYLSLLPSDTSEERRQLIRHALSSVGKIPYYWGGKPSAPGYDGNHFGSLTAADEKGRTMKGLDCSGWINWVYWTATGTRLPAESTEGLARCGTEVAREDLKPGDIIVRLGEEGHVVMFLAWEGDGKMKVLHETSSGLNNVAVSTMQADWPYYRKLID